MPLTPPDLGRRPGTARHRRTRTSWSENAATGAAIALERRSVEHIGLDHVASPGDLVALSLGLPDHRVPVVAETVAMVMQAPPPTNPFVPAHGTAVFVAPAHGGRLVGTVRSSRGNELVIQLARPLPAPR